MYNMPVTQSVACGLSCGYYCIYNHLLCHVSSSLPRITVYTRVLRSRSSELHRLCFTHHVRVFSVAITALGKIGKWHLALDVLNDMGVRGDGTDKPRADAFVYAAAITACGKYGRPVEVNYVTRILFWLCGAFRHSTCR